MIALAIVVGYLIGSAPTANGVARVFGFDLRSSGSGNPGANNARRVGGKGVASIVLVIEMAKGAATAVIGGVMAGEAGAVLGGLGAIVGNIYNIWYRFGGGKGLSITGGVILAVWPLAFPLLIAVIAVALAATRSSGYAALVAAGSSIVLSVVWWAFGWPRVWGIESGGWLVVLTAGLTLALTPKHLHDARHPIS